MKRATWRKHHKWFGLLFCFFLLMFCLSGIVLNHRTWVSDIQISRRWLPASYRFNRWNNGLLRGTLSYTDSLSRQRIVLLYGVGGIWQTDSLASHFTDFNRGLPESADARAIRQMGQMPDGTLFAVGQFNLFCYDHGSGQWKDCSLPLSPHERLTDLATRGDTLIAVGRSRLYLATPPYATFTPLVLQAPEGYDGRVSLFRTVWQLHSGELFGTAGKFLIDGVALVLILLSLTGILYFLLNKRIKRYNLLLKRGAPPTPLAGRRQRTVSLLRLTRLWHDKLGIYTLVLTLFVSLTGWMLRPPVLLALVYGRVPAIPGTNLSSPNPWNDNLRLLRYDADCHDWILSTADGLYSLASLRSVPARITPAPPISVMGANVFTQDNRGDWLVGSFSGMFRWNRSRGEATDYFTGCPAPEKSGAPFGKRAIAGYSNDFSEGPCLVEYDQGTDAIPMPPTLSTLPMSLWNLCLEIHTGRIYTVLGAGTLVYIFFAGLIVIWILVSGYKVRTRGK
ncbi:MAG: PepSY domain-containing protein [Prevotellaceae bacterium]|jgi:hypothetical protein|nr:PepSY domain-containing protein [Prevotellaceae bacterium]